MRLCTKRSIFILGFLPLQVSNELLGHAPTYVNETAFSVPHCVNDMLADWERIWCCQCFTFTLSKTP